MKEARPAEGAFHKTIDQAQGALTEAIDTVKEEAQHQGLPVGV